MNALPFDAAIGPAKSPLPQHQCADMYVNVCLLYHIHSYISQNIQTHHATSTQAVPPRAYQRRPLSAAPPHAWRAVPPPRPRAATSDNQHCCLPMQNQVSTHEYKLAFTRDIVHCNSSNEIDLVVSNHSGHQHQFAC